LLANVSVIQPGKPFYLGVQLTIDEAWHVYWKNPGDSGIPTRVHFKLPDGFTAGPLQYPTPHRFTQPGNITIFGYEGTVLLLAQITPPSTLPPDFQGQFSANVSWLVCQEECIPGKATVNLSLSSASSPQPDNRELFDTWLSQLPVDSANIPDISSVNSSFSGKTCTLTITWAHTPPDSIDFLPDPSDDYTIGPADLKSSQNSTVITFTADLLAGRHPGPTTMQVVLGFQGDQQNRRGINIPVALPG
jgi:DsbC/DsbD-like thiol-disulfide interchange protein